MRQADPWNSIKFERRPEVCPHPDVDGILANHYLSRIGLPIALWPADGPMSKIKWPEDDQC
jgi:hypothetical protein